MSGGAAGQGREACETCRFSHILWRKGETYQQAVSDGYTVEHHPATRQEDRRQCRRNPPGVISEYGTYWPDVGQDDWCGEYERRED